MQDKWLEGLLSVDEIKEILENANDALIVLDAKGNFRYCNPLVFKITGYSPEELMGQTFKKVLPQELIPRITQIFQAHVSGNPTPPYETEVICKGGKRIPVEVSTGPLRVKGAVVGVIGVVREISARKKMENGLRESEEKYRTLFESANDFVFVHDTRGNILEANRAMLESCSCTIDEMRTKTVMDITAPEQLALLPELLKSIPPEGEIRFETVGLRKSGEKVLLDVNARIIQYKGKPAVLCVARDVGERRRMEQKLRESEEMLRATLDSTADGVLVVDRKGKVLASNARFAKMWRIPQKLVDTHDDKTLLDFVLSQLTDPQEFISKVQELYSSNRASFDLLQFKDGRVFERFSEPLLDKGKIAGRVWSFTDVTEKKKVEGELRARIKGLEARLGAGKKQ